MHACSYCRLQLRHHLKVADHRNQPAAAMLHAHIAVCVTCAGLHADLVLAAWWLAVPGEHVPHAEPAVADELSSVAVSLPAVQRVTQPYWRLALEVMCKRFVPGLQTHLPCMLVERPLCLQTLQQDLPISVVRREHMSAAVVSCAQSRQVTWHVTQQLSTLLHQRQSG